VKAILLVSPLMMLISQVAIGQSNAAQGAGCSIRTTVDSSAGHNVELHVRQRTRT